REAGLPAIPDVGFSRFEPDGRLWADWVNGQPDVRAVSVYCGGRKIHAERRAHRETVEDLALLHRATRPEVAFVLGGVHAPERLADYRRAPPRTPGPPPAAPPRKGDSPSATVWPTRWPSGGDFWTAASAAAWPAPPASASSSTARTTTACTPRCWARRPQMPSKSGNRAGGG